MKKNGRSQRTISVRFNGLNKTRKMKTDFAQLRWAGYNSLLNLIAPQANFQFRAAMLVCPINDAYKTL